MKLDCTQLNPTTEDIDDLFNGTSTTNSTITTTTLTTTRISLNTTLIPNTTIALSTKNNSIKSTTLFAKMDLQDKTDKSVEIEIANSTKEINSKYFLD